MDDQQRHQRQTPHTGRWAWQLTGTSSLTQAIAGLPDGTYTLSVWVRASAAGAQLYARGFGGTDRTSVHRQRDGLDARDTDRNRRQQRPLRGGRDHLGSDGDRGAVRGQQRPTLCQRQPPDALLIPQS